MREVFFKHVPSLLKLFFFSRKPEDGPHKTSSQPVVQSGSGSSQSKFHHTYGLSSEAAKINKTLEQKKVEKIMKMSFKKKKEPEAGTSTLQVRGRRIVSSDSD